MTISGVVLTKNEEKNIKNCLDTLKFCDEIIVIDDYSEDKTKRLAKSLGAKVYQRKLNNNFASQRNFGLKKAKGDWVLFIDADERVTLSLAREIKKATKSSEHDGYFLNRQDFWLKKNLKGGEWGRAHLVRLAKKHSGLWKRAVHETWEIKNPGTLENPLLHLPHPSVDDFINSINFYTSLHSIGHIKEGKNPTFFKVLFYPPAKFFLNFVVKRGYTDGTHGFIYAVMLSLHSFITWSSLWYTKNS